MLLLFKVLVDLLFTSMIKKLEIQNFQSHKDSCFEFDSGVNIIIGNTDSGKSAVVRSLKLTNYNRPSGDAYRSWWGGETLVRLTTDDHVIERKKGKKNAYTLDGKEMTAFGTDIPEEVSLAINMGEENYQFQHSRFFLLSATSGEVAQYFNKIAHLDKIDNGTKYLKSNIRSFNNIKEENKEQIKADKVLVKKYKNLPKQESKLEAVEQMTKDLHRSQNQANRLSKTLLQLEQTKQGLKKVKKWQEIDLIVTKNIDRLSTIEQVKKTKEKVLSLLLKIKTIREDLKELKILLSVRPKVDKIFENYKNQKQVQKQTTQLSSVLNKLSAVKSQIKELEILLSKQTTVKDLLKRREDLKRIDKKRFGLNLQLQTYKEIVIEKESLQADLKKMEQAFHDNFPEICPLCGK